MPTPSENVAFTGWTTNDFLAALLVETRKLRAVQSGVDRHLVNAATADHAKLGELLEANASDEWDSIGDPPEVKPRDPGDVLSKRAAKQIAE